MATLAYPAGTYEGFTRHVRFQLWYLSTKHYDVVYSVKPGLRFEGTAVEGKDGILLTDERVGRQSGKPVVELTMQPTMTALAAWIVAYCDGDENDG